jgi:hypothetical protein
MPTLSGNSSLNFASTPRATVVPPTRNLNTGEVLPNFSAFQALGAGAIRTLVFVSFLILVVHNDPSHVELLAARTAVLYCRRPTS